MFIAENKRMRANDILSVLVNECLLFNPPRQIVFFICESPGYAGGLSHLTPWGYNYVFHKLEACVTLFYIIAYIILNGRTTANQISISVSIVYSSDGCPELIIP
jgi:hypothetical protein